MTNVSLLAPGAKWLLVAFACPSWRSPGALLALENLALRQQVALSQLRSFDRAFEIRGQCIGTAARAVTARPRPIAPPTALPPGPHKAGFQPSAVSKYWDD